MQASCAATCRQAYSPALPYARPVYHRSACGEAIARPTSPRSPGGSARHGKKKGGFRGRYRRHESLPLDADQRATSSTSTATGSTARREAGGTRTQSADAPLGFAASKRERSLTAPLPPGDPPEVEREPPPNSRRSVRSRGRSAARPMRFASGSPPRTRGRSRSRPALRFRTRRPAPDPRLRRAATARAADEAPAGSAPPRARWAGTRSSPSRSGRAAW